MRRVILTHWNESEANERAVRLRRAGYRVDIIFQGGGEPFRDVRNKPPDAFVIDLTRLPSHGRAAGAFLRQQKATRLVPIVFVAGDPDKVARVKKELPDAIYTEWSRIRGALTRALKKPPVRPVVPDTMAGYSRTPLPKKLGIKPGKIVALLGVPRNFEKLLGPVRKEIQIKKQARGRADVIVLFVKSVSELFRRLPVAKRTMADGGSLWIAWPKKTSNVASDLPQAIVRKTGLDDGLVDYKICAIDQTWSGLCFARRRKPAGRSQRK